MRLFLAQPDGASPMAGADHSDLVTVAHIVRRLEGNPLAIELARARLEVLSLSELRERLRERFRLLRDPDPLEARHGSLSRAIGWSWEALPSTEQRVLGQLCAFAGGFTIEAARAVVALEPGSSPEAVPQAVAALCRAHLLLPLDADEAPEARYGMWESVREYAAQHPEASGGLEGAWERHAAYFLEWAERRRHHLGGQDWTVTAELGLELANLLAVLRQAGEPEAVAKSAARPEPGRASSTWTRAGLAAALMASLYFDRRVSHWRSREVLETARHLAATRGLARTEPWHLELLLRLGKVESYCGRLDAAKANLLEAVELARSCAAGDPEARGLDP